MAGHSRGSMRPGLSPWSASSSAVTYTARRAIRVRHRAANDGHKRTMGVKCSEQLAWTPDGVCPGQHRCDSRGQGRGRTADLPLFRIKDHCPVLAKLVFQPAQRATVIRHRLRCTNMNETRNETAEPVGVQPST